ncbi:MAG: hypothetical protein ACRYHQ_34470, partial [Janthinobacterium lividum]
MSATVAGLSTAGSRSSRFSRAMRWQRRYGLAAFGAAIVLGWLLVAAFAPMVAPFPPDLVDVTQRLLPSGGAHPLGTDELGRDVLSRLIFGARISMLTGIVVVMLGAFVGTVLGAIAA